MGTGGSGFQGWTMPFLAGLLLMATVGVLLAGLVFAFQLVHSDVVYPGVRIGDVSVGGMNRERAISELRPVFAERAARPVVVRAIGQEEAVAAAALGATFDAVVAADAAYAVGRTGVWSVGLAAQINALLHGHSVDSPGVRIDGARLGAYLRQKSEEIDRPVVEAVLSLGEDLGVRITPSVVGRKLDVDRAGTLIERAIVTGAGSVDLPVVETAPRTTEGDLDETRVRLATMLSGPVALEFEGRRWEVSLKEIAGLLSLEKKIGVPAPVISLNDKPLKELVSGIAKEVDQPKVSPRFDWSNGELVLLKQGQDGRKADPDRALVLLKEAISSSRRVVPLPVAVEGVVGGSIDPAKLDMRERIEFGRTTITGVPEKVHNIKLAASRLNGVLLAPGDIFSFNAELGPTTLKAGFQTGFGISVQNGQMETVPSVAGGICQVATTLLHAVFWAGYQIEERFPHMYWIPGYGQPPRGLTGLDATVEDPVLDFKFMNNTDHYLLIQSRVQGDVLEFSLYGKRPDWDVQVEGPIITNVVKADPKQVRQEEPTWPEGRELQVEVARDGMDVLIVRKVTLNGEVRTLNLKSAYRPSRNVILMGPKPTPTPMPSATATPVPRDTPRPGAGLATATPTPTKPATPPVPSSPTPPGG